MGGASLLGAHLSERMIAEGHEVIAVDDFTSGSFATLAHLKREPRFAFVEHDVTRRFEAHVDAVYQLALPSSRRACASDPVRATVTSVMGTLHALELAAQHGARVVLATSAERCGEGVRCAEALAVDFARTRRVDARIVRAFSAYGPRMAADDEHVVARLAVRAVLGEPVAAAGDADAPLCLAYVADAVETLAAAIVVDRAPSAVEAPFVTTSLRAVVEAVEEAASGAAVAPQAPSSSRPGPTNLHEGVGRTVRWFEERLGRRAPAPRTSGIFGPPPLPAAAAARSA